ncbi:choice-of-anchor E domain-containing protein [Aliinostoc sp. HNIBRCY26]|uniref:choice-of-anchor E domain-containing protein n=1 Tax=Aliinostoc sp. HNIBRCY26 TaxID=3418997 RepID=UPI003D00C9A9
MTTTLFKTIGAATTLAAIALTAGSANAASLSYTSATSLQATNITNAPLSIQKFDSALGTLNSVTLKFTGDLQGLARFENLSPSPATVTVNLGGQLGLKLGSQSLLSLNPTQSYNYEVSSFDNNLNFDGTSGKTVDGLMASGTSTQSFTNNSLLQAFTGTGNIDLSFSALASSTVIGSGNFISQIQTFAKAGVEVVYNYDPVKSVPEPSAALGFGLFAGIGLLSQRKKIRLKASN